MRSIVLAAIYTVLFLAASPCRAGAAEAKDVLSRFDSTGKTRKCVQSYQISETRVLDQDRILFRLGARQYYVNRLFRPCPELQLQQRFGYELHGTSELCRGDAIRVLDGIGTGAGCLLGEFEKLDEKKARN